MASSLRSGHGFAVPLVTCSFAVSFGDVRRTSAYRCQDGVLAALRYADSGGRCPTVSSPFVIGEHKAALMDND